MAWAVRGRSSTVFADAIWRLPGDRRRLALTFDDGPSESTPQLLELLDRLGVKATFFMCGAHVRRLPEIATAVRDAGHCIGNHTQHHAMLSLKGQSFIRAEITAAQDSILDVTGVRPEWFRAPYGVHWMGLRQVQRELGLKDVMWSVIGFDWRLPADRVANRIVKHASPGGILCLHDGRVLLQDPDISSTIDAVRIALPKLIDAGYEIEWITDHE